MNDEELRKYYNVILDCWRLMKKSMENLAATDEFADSVAKEADEIFRKHGKTEFAKAQVLSVVDEVDRLMKGVGKNE